MLDSSNKKKRARSTTRESILSKLKDARDKKRAAEHALTVASDNLKSMVVQVTKKSMNDLLSKEVTNVERVLKTIFAKRIAVQETHLCSYREFWAYLNGETDECPVLFSVQFVAVKNTSLTNATITVELEEVSHRGGHIKPESLRVFINIFQDDASLQEFLDWAIDMCSGGTAGERDAFSSTTLAYLKGYIQNLMLNFVHMYLSEHEKPDEAFIGEELFRLYVTFKH